MFSVSKTPQFSAQGLASLEDVGKMDDRRPKGKPGTNEIHSISLGRMD